MSSNLISLFVLLLTFGWMSMASIAYDGYGVSAAGADELHSFFTATTYGDDDGSDDGSSDDGSSDDD